jgi:hypothetical protein
MSYLQLTFIAIRKQLHLPVDGIWPEHPSFNQVIVVYKVFNEQSVLLRYLKGHCSEDIMHHKTFSVSTLHSVILSSGKSLHILAKRSQTLHL